MFIEIRAGTGGGKQGAESRAGEPWGKETEPNHNKDEQRAMAQRLKTGPRRQPGESAGLAPGLRRKASCGLFAGRRSSICAKGNICEA